MNKLNTNASASEIREKLLSVNNSTGTLKRITFSLDGQELEHPTAELIGANKYRLTSPVLFTEGVCYGDIVAATPDANESNVLHFNGVVERGDYSALVTMGEFYRKRMKNGLQRLRENGVIVKQWPDYLALITARKPFDAVKITTAFSGKNVPIQFIAPPGPWVADVIMEIENGNEAAGVQLIEEKRREFFSGLQIVMARLKTGEWVDGDQVDLSRN